MADTYNHRIQKFDSQGAFITTWGKWGTGDDQFDYPCGVAVDSSGNLYTADTDNDRIQKFNSQGAFITTWGIEGAGDGQFKFPEGVAIDSSGNVYVADYYNNRIQKFRPITIITGSLTITSIPSSAKIYIDGDDTGQVTNHTFANLTPGTHTIKLTLSGCSDWYGAATV